MWIFILLFSSPSSVQNISEEGKRKGQNMHVLYSVLFLKFPCFSCVLNYIGHLRKMSFFNRFKAGFSLSKMSFRYNQSMASFGQTNE